MCNGVTVFAVSGVCSKTPEILAGSCKIHVAGTLAVRVPGKRRNMVAAGRDHVYGSGSIRSSQKLGKLR
jgi:hypothetical protein